MRVPYRYAVSLTTALALFMAVLDNTIVNVSLTAMQESFGTDLNTIQWVITAYFLAQAAVIPAAGYLSTRFGLKRVFVLALAVFTLGSLLCGLTPSIPGDGGTSLLVVFRVVQGIGGGALFPLGTAITFGAFPPEERAASSAVVGVPVLIAPTIGPTIGGLLVDSAAGWPWIFLINVPLGVVAILLFLRIFRPEADTRPTGERLPFDVLGLVLSMVGVLLVVYSFTLIGETRPGSVSAAAPQGEIWGWGYWLVWTLLGAGLALLLVFGLYETRVARDPVLDLRLFRTYAFTVSTVLTWGTRAIVFGSFFLIPLYLQQFRGLSAVAAGLAFVPQGIGAGLGVASGSRLYNLIGPRALVVLGMVCLTVSTFFLIGLDTTTDSWDLAPILFLRGLGFGWGALPLQTVALETITGRALAKASSLFNATAQVFSSIGIAVLSTLFLAGVTSRTAALTATAAGAEAADIPLRAGASAVSEVFRLLTIATAVMTVLSLLLPRRSLRQETAAHEGADVPDQPTAAE